MNRRPLALLALCALCAGGCGEAEGEAAKATATVDPALVKRGTGEAPQQPAPRRRPIPAAVRAQLASGEIGVVDLTGAVGVRPQRLAVSDDGDLRSLDWTTWAADGAAATGQLRLTRCNPSCAQGEVITYAARVSLSDAKLCDGDRYFDRARVEFEGDEGTVAPAVYIRAPC